MEGENKEIKVKNFYCEELSQYTESMLFDSGEEIAYGEFQVNGHNVSVSLEVRGEVRVTYKGETYRTPTEFPDELKALIKEHPHNWDAYSPSGEGNDKEDGNIFVGNNNWFEFIFSVEDEPENDGFVCEIDLSEAGADDVLKEMLKVAVWAAESASHRVLDCENRIVDLEKQCLSQMEKWNGEAANMYSTFSITDISRNDFVSGLVKMKKNGMLLADASILETGFSFAVDNEDNDKDFADEEVQDVFSFVIFKLEPEAVYTISEYFPGKLCVGGTDWDETKVFVAKDGRQAKAGKDYTFSCTLCCDTGETGYVDFEYQIHTPEGVTAFIGGSGMVCTSDALKVIKLSQ